MRVLITGAAGFLGRWFVAHHLISGDEVVAVDDFSSPHAFWAAELDFGPHRIDAAAYLQSPESYRTWDIVYWFAAPVGGRVTIEGDPLFNADSLRLDSALFRWAADVNPGVIVYPSSSAVYGAALQTGAGTSLTEKMFDPARSAWRAPDEMYGFTKLTGEFLAWKAQKYKVNTLCIRPFSGYGEDQSLEYPVPSIMARIAAREDPLVVWGTGQQRRDFVHVSDVVGATVARVEAGVKGYAAMNIGSGIPISFLEIARMGADIEGYSPTITTDTSKPAGVDSRWCDPDLMRKFYSLKVPLRAGLTRVLEGQRAKNHSRVA